MSWLVIGFVVFLTICYAVISFAFPEWVGMTGKKALEIQQHQKGESDDTPSDSKN